MGIHRRSPMEITARAGWWFCLLVFLCTTTTVEMTDTTVELLDDAFSVDKLDHVMELSPNDQRQVDRTVREALAKMDAPHQKEKAESKRKIPTSSVSLGSSSRLQQEARSRIKAMQSLKEAGTQTALQHAASDAPDEDEAEDEDEDEEGGKTKKKKPAGPMPDPVWSKADPKRTFDKSKPTGEQMKPFLFPGWKKVEESLLDLPIARAKSFFEVKGIPQPETSIGILKTYAGYAETEVEGQCERKVDRKTALVLLDGEFVEVFQNDLDKKYLPKVTHLGKDISVKHEENLAGHASLYADSVSPRPSRRAELGQALELANNRRSRKRAMSDEALSARFALAAQRWKAHEGLRGAYELRESALTKDPCPPCPDPCPIDNWCKRYALQMNFALVNKDPACNRTSALGSKLMGGPDEKGCAGSHLLKYGEDKWLLKNLTFEAGWVRGNASFPPPTYSVRGATGKKMCSLEGAAKNKNAADGPSTVFKLDTDCRPSQELVFNLGTVAKKPTSADPPAEYQLLGESSSVSDRAQLDGTGTYLSIKPDGYVVVTGKLSKYEMVYLAGVVFPIGAGDAWNTDWSTVGQSPPKVHVRDQECALSGLISKASVIGAQKIGQLPAKCSQLNRAFRFEVNNFKRSAYVDISATGEVTLAAGPDGVTVADFDSKWISLSGIFVPVGAVPSLTIDSHRHLGVVSSKNGPTIHHLGVRTEQGWGQWQLNPKKYTDATYTEDQDGFCRVQGAISLVKPIAAGLLGNFSEACIPFENQIFEVGTTEGKATIQVTRRGQIEWVAGESKANMTVFLSGIGFSSFNHMRQVKNLPRKCVTGRWESYFTPCFKTTWRDVMFAWSGKQFRATFSDVCYKDPVFGAAAIAKDAVKRTLFTDWTKITDLCENIQTCIKAVAFWGNASSWTPECNAKAQKKVDEANLISNEDGWGDLSDAIKEDVRSKAEEACWAKKVRAGPLDGGNWNPGALQGSDPTVVWKSKKQYEPFSNPCDVMKLQSVKKFLHAWKLPKGAGGAVDFKSGRPDFGGLAFREPPNGLPELLLDFNETKGGLYALEKPLMKWDQDAWDIALGNTTVLDTYSATDAKGEPQKLLQYYFKKDPLPVKMAISKKQMMSAKKTQFTKYALCLSWTSVNHKSKVVKGSPAYKELTVPYKYKPCERIYRPNVVMKRLKKLCDMADPLGWQPGVRGCGMLHGEKCDDQLAPLDNFTDPVPFLIGAAGMKDVSNRSSWSPKHYYPHTTAKVWQTNTLKSCVFQKGAKYRGYKVPKYLCYPGGHMENVTSNGVTQSKLISGGTDDCLEMKVDKITNISSPRIKKNKWCENTCIDRTEIIYYTKLVKIVAKKHEQEKAIFARFNSSVYGQKTVTQEKVDESVMINSTMKNETVLSGKMTKDTAKMWQANTTDARQIQAQKIQKLIEEKLVEEVRAKVAAAKLLKLIQEERERTQKKILWREREKKRLEAAKARLKAAKDAHAEAVEGLRRKQELVNATIAAWPGWVGTRYEFLSLREPGSWLFPTKCQDRGYTQKNQTDDKLKFDKSLAKAIAAATAAGETIPASARMSQLSKKEELYKGDKWVKTSTFLNIPAGQYLVSADFCGAEAEAGAEEKLAVMELCEANAYMKESRCCQSSTMAMAYPSCNSLGVSPYGDGGRCLSPFEVRYEVDTLKDY